MQICGDDDVDPHDHTGIAERADASFSEDEAAKSYKSTVTPATDDPHVNEPATSSEGIPMATPRAPIAVRTESTVCRIAHSGDGLRYKASCSTRVHSISTLQAKLVMIRLCDSSVLVKGFTHSLVDGFCKKGNCTLRVHCNIPLKVNHVTHMFSLCSVHVYRTKRAYIRGPTVVQAVNASPYSVAQREAQGTPLGTFRDTDRLVSRALSGTVLQRADSNPRRISCSLPVMRLMGFA